MGKYINGIGTTYTEKIKALREQHNAVVTDSSFKKDLVCVVDNVLFAAAGYMYSEEERNEFANPADDRRKTWLIVPNVENLI